MNLDNILTKIKKDGIAADIDETLSWTIGYWVEKMQKLFGNPEQLSVQQLINKYRYTWNVPYWQSKEALDWLEKNRNSNELQKELRVIQDSNIYLNKINQIIPINSYITTRPETVETGTKEWLNINKFPDAPLILRPNEVPVEKGNEWKAKILEVLYPKVQGIIDDSSGLLTFINPEYKGIIFLYNHASVESKINAVSCKDWKMVYQEVKKYSKR